MEGPVSAQPRVHVYIPHPESRLCNELAHGSAIVGLPLPNGSVRIYYEGNIFGAANLGTYRQKAVQAAGRMLYNYPSGYPTRAREDVDPREVVHIGTLDIRTNSLELSARADDLSWWIDAADLADLR